MAKYGPESVLTRSEHSYELRHLNEQDVDACLSLREKAANESNFTLQYPGRPRPDPNEYALRLATAEDSQGILNLGALCEGELIAHLQISIPHPDHPWIKHIGYFGMMVLRQHWGRGVGRALIERGLDFCRRSGITKLEGEVRTTNYRAQYLYLSAGFRIEGLREDAALIDGKMHDEFHLGWNQNKSLPAINFELKLNDLLIRPAWRVQPASLADFYRRNKDHFTGPTLPEGQLTEEYWWCRRANALAEFYADKSLRWVVSPAASLHHVIGSADFFAIRREPDSSCYCDGAIDKDWRGRGLMSDVFQITSRYMIDHHSLQKIHFVEGVCI